MGFDFSHDIQFVKIGKFSKKSYFSSGISFGSEFAPCEQLPLGRTRSFDRLFLRHSQRGYPHLPIVLCPLRSWPSPIQESYSSMIV
jgi:hypothetical protein